MSRSSKHRAQTGKGCGVGSALALVVLAGLGFLVWWSWPASKSTKLSSVKEAASNGTAVKVLVQRRPAATNRPVIVVRESAISATNYSPTTESAGPKTNSPAPNRRSTSAGTNTSPDLLLIQIGLARLHISPGSIDGVVGYQTRAALRAFQRSVGLPGTGQVDEATRQKLQVDPPFFTNYTVTAQDLGRLQPLSRSWVGKSQQSALDYETILELIAEATQAHPNLVRRLNPGLSWTNITAGQEVIVPNIPCTPPTSKAGFVVISLEDRLMEVFDANTNLLCHFPCSIAQRVEKRPAGELHVSVMAPDPNYTFDPDLFPESQEARQLRNRLVLPPGPNNPVGVAWIGLDLPGYGIHGTPSPEQVGRTESHGCFRLANWNARYLLTLAWVGMPVYVVHTATNFSF